MKRKMGMIFSFSVVGLLVVVLLVYYFGAFYPTFNKMNRTNEFEIPGLKEDFVPQGIEYLENEGLFLVSGYMSNGEPSRIYVIDKFSGEVVKYVTAKNGSVDYTGHAGGVTTDGTHLWLVGDKELYTLTLADLIGAENKSSISIKSFIKTGNGCDFVKVYKNTLLVGEFYRAGKYDTPESHHIKVSENETSNALLYAYNLSSESESGIETTPIYALTLPDHAQGIAVTMKNDEEKFVVSTSWSIPSSKILVYNSPLTKPCTKSITLSGKEVPLFELNSSNLENEISVPAMSEEMTVVDGKVFILFESACNKYRRVNRTRTKFVQSIII